MRRTVAFGACVLVACVVLRGDADFSPQQTPKFTAGVDVVELDVTVLDKNHKPVRGLKSDDFAVREDGAPQKIVAFTSVDVPPPVVPSAKWMNDVSPDVESNDLADHRLFVIIIDDALSAADVKKALWNMRETRKAAMATLATLGSGDEAAVIFTGQDSEGQDFTTDHAKLTAAIGRIRPLSPIAGPCGPTLASMEALQVAAEALSAIPHRKKVVLYISVGPAIPLVGPAGGCAGQAQ